MALIKNDISVSNEEFERALTVVNSYIEMLPNNMKESSTKDENLFSSKYVDTFLAVFNKGKNTDSYVNFLNFNNEQVLKLINAIANSYNTIRVKIDKFEINNEQDTVKMSDNYLRVYDKIFQYILDALREFYGKEITNDENSVNEIAKDIVNCCTNNFSDANRNCFSYNFSSYMDFYNSLNKKVNNTVKEHFCKNLQSGISVAHL